MEVTVVVGNPKPRSRTSIAAGMLAAQLGAGPTDQVIDVVELGAGLLDWGDPTVRLAMDRVSASDVVVFASPTFKASYSGILKLFLDQFETGTGLQDVTVIPLMLGAGPAHALAPELLLRPVLVELGAVVPAPALYLIDSDQDWGEHIRRYIERWGNQIFAAASTTGKDTHDKCSGTD